MINNGINRQSAWKMKRNTSGEHLCRNSSTKPFIDIFISNIHFNWQSILIIIIEVLSKGDHRHGHASLCSYSNKYETPLHDQWNVNWVLAFNCIVLLHNMQNALHENPFCFIHLQHKCRFSRSLRTILLLIFLFLFRAQNNIGPFTTPSQGTSHLVENLKRKRVVSNWRVLSAIITLRRGLCGLLLGRKSTPLQLQSRIWFLICFQIPQIYSANLFLQLFGIVFCLMQ